MAVALACVAAGGAAFGASARGPGRYDMSGIDGSHGATMQVVDTALRIALVAAVPDSPAREAWGIARSTAKIPGWAGEKGGGQTVFAHYTEATGWILTGPAVDAASRPQNPRINAIAISRSGDGWAVGDSGAMVHLAGGRWVTQAPAVPGVLTSLSLAATPGGTVGYALGEGSTVLRLANGAWSRDSRAITPASGQTWTLTAIAAVDTEHAWAVGHASRGALVLRRTPGGWARVTTGDSLFDEQTQPRTVGTMVVAAADASSVSADSRGAWVGGTIIPVDAAIGDPAGDATRPFVLRFAGSVTSYCPDQYSTGSGGATTTAMCDRPLPLSGFGITSIQRLDGGHVFAGGLGLFHFDGTSWFREPDPIGPVSSLSFSSESEGWIAGTGDTVGASGSVTSITTLGHWTRSVQNAHMARWPEPVTHSFSGITQIMEAVASEPGTGRALAVGGGGASILYTPGTGWDSFTPVSPYPFHAVAWPGADAWLVGGRGTIFRYNGGASVTPDPASENATTASLFGVAFTSPSRGYAVGANGTILAYRSGRWSVDPASRRATDADLYAIAATGGEFVAAGTDGTVLATTAGVWHRVDGLDALLSRGGLPSQGGELPALYAVAALPNGGALIGGELSTLIRRDSAAGAWRVDSDSAGRVPPEGTIVALAARGDEEVASVAAERLKYVGDTPSIVTAGVLRATRRGWQDVAHGERQTIYPSFDASGSRDPVYSFSFDGSAVWGVGGVGPGTDDGQGHDQNYPTSAIFRIDTGADPNPSGYSTTPDLSAAASLVNFAFFGNSSCGRGLCGVTAGTGTKADVVAQQLQREINDASALPGGPRFVVFGGNMRGIGIPEELGEFKKFLAGFRIPVFAAIGPKDLFSGLQSSAVDGTAAGGQTQVQPSSGFWSQTFADRPRPWGNGAPLPDFKPVLENNTSGAHTHYAFDYAPGGTPRLRVVVVDDSATGRYTASTGQNPAEDQGSWLQRVLQTSVPSIIVMNRSATDPLDLTSAAYPEAEPIQNLAAQVGASAVLTSSFGENGVTMLRVPGVAATVPVYVLGGGGGPLKSSPGNPPAPPDPSVGFYHSWQNVSMDASSKGVVGSAYEVDVRSYPVVDSVALHAIDGNAVTAGNTLRFVGAGHTPEGGGPGDPLQSRASVIPFTFAARGVCPPDRTAGFRPRCLTTGPVGPQFYFRSEDEKVGYFVRPSPLDETLPDIDPATGGPVADPTSGLFCAVGGGTTHVDIQSGFHQSRMLVSVGSGFGPCVHAPVIVPPVVPLTQPQPHPVPLPQPADFPLPVHVAQDNNAVALVPPPPVPIIAPAPPAAGGFARKEQHEEAREDAGQKFFALPLGARLVRPGEIPLGAVAGPGPLSLPQGARAMAAADDSGTQGAFPLGAAGAVAAVAGVVLAGAASKMRRPRESTVRARGGRR